MKRNFIKAVCFVFAISLGCSFASARKFPMKKVEPANATIPAVVVPKQETVETIKETVDVKVIDTKEIKDEAANKTEQAAKEVKETVQENVSEVKQNATEASATAKESAEDITKEIKLETPAETTTKPVETAAPAVQTESTVIEKKEGTIFDLVKPMTPVQKQEK